MAGLMSLALDLAAGPGFYVFPVHHDEGKNTKKPLTKNGHLDATQDPGVIQDWWEKWPFAKVGVDAGRSGLNVLDVDVKSGHDGWESLAESWRDIPETFSYETGTGGSHLVYAAPEGVALNGTANYLGMDGVDRRAGSSWVLWVGPVPDPEEILPAPAWLNEVAAPRKKREYSGTLSEWASGLVPGEPNAVVRNAWKRAQEKFDSQGKDFSHSDMAELQYEAVRISCEGNPGGLEYLEFLEELFLSREGAHTRPDELWSDEWEEALLSAIAKYGDMVPEFKTLPEYSLGVVPPEIPDTLVTTPSGKAGFSKLLGELVRCEVDDKKAASILWNCPATRELSREWGLLFIFKRIADARVKPEPTRENPKIEEKREEVEKGDDFDLKLTTAEEDAFIAQRPTFVNYVCDIARGLGYDQMGYFESIAWNLASMAFGHKGYVPVSATQRHGLNIWQIVPGYSGTGKSVVDSIQTQCLDIIMANDSDEVPYDLGADSSIQGLHLALLQRDGLASLFSADEASGWFKRLKSSEWTTGMEDMLADWYMGRVSGSNKISLKELRGKSAKTSFNLHMFATPDRLMETLTREQFMSGFLARVMWTFGNPREETDEMFDIFKESSDEVEDVSVAPQVIQSIAGDLITARSFFTEPVSLKPTAEAKQRMRAAYKKMYKSLQGKKNWDVIEPALTRHMEAMLKAAGICAMYRGSKQIALEDALHAIQAVEGWARNLVRVADLVSQGDFQRKADELEAFLLQSGGTVTGAKIYHRFKNWIVRDSKEIENVLTYLSQAGIINRDDSGGNLRYTLNGQG